ncbi:MAG: hypothetical protein RSC93_02530 [Erysipelotrichaceae bacterium]
MNENLIKIEIGKKFPYFSKIMYEGPSIIFLQGYFSLTISGSCWRESEINEIRRGDLDIFLLEYNDIEGFYIRFKEWQSDVYFNINTLPAKDEVYPHFIKFESKEGMTLPIYTLDEKGIVISNRFVRLSNTMSNRIIEIIEKQYKNVDGLYDEEPYDARLDDLLNNVPVPDLEKYATHCMKYKR